MTETGVSPSDSHYARNSSLIIRHSVRNKVLRGDYVRPSILLSFSWPSIRDWIFRLIFLKFFTKFFKRSSLFWVVTLHRSVVIYRRFGTICRPHLQCASRPRRITNNLRCVTTQKSEDLIYFAAEAWNHAKFVPTTMRFMKFCSVTVAFHLNHEWVRTISNTSFFYWRYNPLWVCILQPPSGAIASSRTRFLDHTQRRATVGRTPLDEWSVRRRDLYLTTHNTHNRQTSMPPVGWSDGGYILFIESIEVTKCTEKLVSKF